MIFRSSDYIAVATSLYSSLDCARSLTCEILLRYNELEQLVSLEFDPLHYNDVNAARDALLATKFLSKAEFLKIKSIDRRASAIEKFYLAEDRCKDTNRNLKTLLSNDNQVATIFSIAARKIFSVLGDITAEELFDGMAWGPGATFSLKRSSSSVHNKFRSETGISPLCADVWLPAMRLAFPTWERLHHISIEPANRVVTVPKNAKTDRVIAIEPGLNIFVQKALGSAIRRRLKRNGVDLDDQSWNQKFCKLGSRSGHLATIDFSAASDTISREIVQELLPPRWFLLLDSCRSRFGLVGDTRIAYEKFSSMGNGFTFELESLIFWALAWATCENLGIEKSGLSVYGDDVILPVDAYSVYHRVMSDAGFRVNEEKSYSSSYYRESCGKHYWNGTDITPIFFKKRINHEVDLYKLANSIRRCAHSRNSYGCDRRLLDSWQMVCRYLARFSLKYISDGYGDGGLIVNFDECSPSKARSGYEGFFSKAFVTSTIPHRHEDFPVLLGNLYEHERSICHDGVKGLSYQRLGSTFTLRARKLSSRESFEVIPGRVRVSVKRLLIPHWCDLGPWI